MSVRFHSEGVCLLQGHGENYKEESNCRTTLTRAITSIHTSCLNRSAKACGSLTVRL